MGTAEVALYQQDIEFLYAHHHGWLQGWLRRKLGNSFDAADIAQDTFVRMLARPHLPALNEPRTYLSTIARGLVIDHWRRRELEQAWLETLAGLPEPEVPSAEVRMIFLEALIEIDRMLDALKPPVRTAFLLAQLDGLTCPEIAQRLEVSLATVERYIAKALRSCYAICFES
ncbi:sigma-70 family RNA polymerase sigma factor [Ottowia thiooxydans]|uniref:sigma-70 family RNA polymerase sigma factor n=1 Tax=Ottowia thiooxydans TaxID=219182 RepID=UPI0003F6AD51|nr:sigma-70 family RNA polymerase sigma factor [Ottowia thiooxydans]